MGCDALPVDLDFATKNYQVDREISFAGRSPLPRNENDHGYWSFVVTTLTIATCSILLKIFEIRFLGPKFHREAHWKNVQKSRFATDLEAFAPGPVRALRVFEGPLYAQPAGHRGLVGLRIVRRVLGRVAEACTHPADAGNRRSDSRAPTPGRHNRRLLKLQLQLEAKNDVSWANARVVRR